MKTLIVASICAVMIIIRPAYVSSENNNTVPPEESARILRLIFSRSVDIYKKYSGVESIRKEIHQEFDPDNNALRSTSELTTHRIDYFYEKPDIRALSLKKDGKETDPSKHRIWKMMPIYPVFDEKSSESYELKITDKKNIKGRECYRIQVLPKKETSRHFRGSIYCTVGTLETVQIEGTLAKLDFPLKEFRMEFSTILVKEVPVLHKGAVKVRVKVPIFFPDTLIVTQITVLESKLIEYNEKAR